MMMTHEVDARRYPQVAQLALLTPAGSAYDPIRVLISVTEMPIPEDAYERHTGPTLKPPQPGRPRVRATNGKDPE